MGIRHGEKHIEKKNNTVKKDNIYIYIYVCQKYKGFDMIQQQHTMSENEQDLGSFMLIVSKVIPCGHPLPALASHAGLPIASALQPCDTCGTTRVTVASRTTLSSSDILLYG